MDSGLCGSCTKWLELWKCKECFSWLFTKMSHMLGPDDAPDPAHAQKWWKWNNRQFFLHTWLQTSGKAAVALSFMHMYEKKSLRLFSSCSSLTHWLHICSLSSERLRGEVGVFLRHLKMFKFKSGKSQSRNICSAAPSHNHGSSYWPQEINNMW